MVNPTTEQVASVPIFNRLSPDDQALLASAAELMSFEAGDKVIKRLAEILSSVLRERARRSFLGHIGGDDFFYLVDLETFEDCCREQWNDAREADPHQGMSAKSKKCCSSQAGMAKRRREHDGPKR